jgi:sec-independent protein translocase protein TatA
MITLAILLGMIGPWQIILILIIVLLLFGGKKIPELMRGLGKGAREFKEGISGADDEKEKDKEVDKKEK